MIVSERKRPTREGPSRSRPPPDPAHGADRPGRAIGHGPGVTVRPPSGGVSRVVPLGREVTRQADGGLAWGPGLLAVGPAGFWHGPAPRRAARGEYFVA